MENAKTIGLSLWLGPMPNYIKDTIINNSDYFDEFYCITPEVFHTGQVKVLPVEPLYKYLKDLRLDYLKPNFISDIVTYSAIQVLIKYKILVKKVMVVDADYWLYNRFLIKDIFEKCNNFICLKDSNYYLQNDTDYYYNAGVSFDLESSNESMMYLEEAVKLCDPNMYYTTIGPRLINSSWSRERLDKILHSSKIEPFALDPHVLYKGVNKVNLKHGSLGFHYTHSVIKGLGLQLDWIRFNSSTGQIEFLVK
jgi:hypothetical protein